MPTHPFGKPNSMSLCGPSMKVETRNQLVGLLPASSFGPLLTPSANRVTLWPVDVGVSSGWSARRPMICILASGRVVLVEKARTAEVEAARGSVRRDCIVVGGFADVNVM
jgi:hypothetical protein